MSDPAIHTALEAARALREQGLLGVGSAPATIDSDGLVLAVANPSHDSKALEAWVGGLRETEAGATVAALGDLALDPCAVMGKGRLAIVSPCGRPFSGVEVDILALLVLPRPADSYCVILTGAEKLQGPEAMEQTLRAARRVVTQNSAARDRQIVYLWGDAAADGTIAARLESDRQALAQWIKATPTDKSMEALMEVNTALDEALADFQRPSTSSSPATAAPAIPGDIETLGLQRMRDALREIKSKIALRWQTETERTANQLNNAFTGFSSNLGSHLRQAANDASLPPEQTEKAIGEITLKELARFVRELEQLVVERIDHALAEAKTVLLIADWVPYNKRSATVEAQPGKLLREAGEVLKRPLLTAGAGPEASRTVKMNGLAAGSAAADWAMALPQSGYLGLIAGAAVGVAVSPVLGFMAPWIGVGLAGAGWLVGFQTGSARGERLRSEAVQAQLDKGLFQLQAKQRELLTEITRLMKTAQDQIDDGLTGILREVEMALAARTVAVAEKQESSGNSNQ